MAAAALHSHERVLAGGLALVMHAAFFVLIVFGVTWQQKHVDTAMVVDLWRDLPVAEAPEPPPPPPPPAVKPEPPKPAPRVEAQPPPKPEVVPKADIALKEKQEKDRQEKEKKLKEQQALEAKKLAAEKQRQAEADQKKRAEALKKQQAAEAEAKRIAAEEAKVREAAAAQQAAAQRKEIDKYLDGIRARVRRAVVVPPNIPGNPEAELVVTLLPGGEVLDVKLRKSSGHAAYDAAVERAIRQAQPFSVPAGDMFQQYFRQFTMAFRPNQ